MPVSGPICPEQDQLLLRRAMLQQRLKQLKNEASAALWQRYHKLRESLPLPIFNPKQSSSSHTPSSSFSMESQQVYLESQYSGLDQEPRAEHSSSLGNNAARSCGPWMELKCPARYLTEKFQESAQNIRCYYAAIMESLCALYCSDSFCRVRARKG